MSKTSYDQPVMNGQSGQDRPEVTLEARVQALENAVMVLLFEVITRLTKQKVDKQDQIASIEESAQIILYNQQSYLVGSADQGDDGVPQE